VAYISHLDLQRLFLRVFRAAEMKPAYSSGFNPHPKLGLALPLSTGFSSDCEYLEVETDAAPSAVAERLRGRMPEGIEIRNVWEKETWERDVAGAGGGKSLASRVRFAEYEIIAPSFAGVETALETYLRKDAILIEKESRKTKRISRVDIRPLISAFECVRVFNRLVQFRCTLAAGGDKNLNPLTLMESFYESSGLAFDADAFDVRRTRILFT
jgi:radical SAM-linked protein